MNGIIGNTAAGDFRGFFIAYRAEQHITVGGNIVVRLIGRSILVIIVISSQTWRTLTLGIPFNR